MNGVQTRFKCKLDVKRCKRFVFPPSSLLPRSNALKTKAIRYFQTDRTLTRIVSPPLSEGAQYVYCKKLVKNETGERPLYTGYHSKVNAYYYGTYVNGEEFDGCFDGYSAIDRDIPIPPVKEPTVFDSFVDFEVSGVVAGWAAALQLMRMGERWMLYIPYQSGYGINDYTAPYSTNTIPGGSLLTFDLQLVSFAE